MRGYFTFGTKDINEADYTLLAFRLGDGRDSSSSPLVD
jgi:hypothetical protein